MKKWKIALLQMVSMTVTVYTIGIVCELKNDIISFLSGGIVVACFMMFSWADKQGRL